MGNDDLAGWLIVRRAEIEGILSTRLGPARPDPAGPESEVLRRFRSFAAAALRRGSAAQPALEGILANEKRVAALLTAWVDAAAEVGGPEGAGIRSALLPWLKTFQSSLRTSAVGRGRSGAPRTKRRAVNAAIDRVADAFLAVDADTGQVVDANPAAGALLGVVRDALLGVEAAAFVSEESRGEFQGELDAVAEGSESRRFRGRLRDAQGGEVAVDCTVTAFSTRDRTLALILARPSGDVVGLEV
jgi:PAS domain S-box-containing protein